MNVNIDEIEVNRQISALYDEATPFERDSEDFKQACRELKERLLMKNSLDDFDPRSPEGVKATRLFEISSVAIHVYNTDGDTRPYELYGFIQVIDEDGFKLDVFNRKLNNPLVVPIGGSLLLNDPSIICPVIPHEHCKVLVFLIDRTRDVEVAQGSFYVNFDPQLQYDQLKRTRVYGKSGFAIMHYYTFRCAIIAYVDMQLITETQPPDVYGKICATTKGRDGDISRVLFEKQRSQCLGCVNMDNLWSTKFIFAVPAYASLRIHMDLLDGNTSQPLATGVTLDFMADDHILPNEKEIPGNNCKVLVDLRWNHAYYYIDDEEITSFPGDVEDKSDGDKQERKRPRMDPGQKLALGIPEYRPKVSGTSKRASQPLTEVFGVFIQSDFGSLVALHGTIGACDNFDEFAFFKKDRSDPVILASDVKSLSLVQPNRCLRGSRFIMMLDIMDHEDREISKGFIHWCVGNVTSPINWYDRRMCSVIRGKFGHALIHYVIFSDGVEAKVTVSFVGSCGSLFDVYGKIVAEYNCYSYKTEYEKKFDTSAMFARDSRECVQISNDMEFPLSKHYIAVPSDSFLKVKAELYVRPHGKNKFDELVGVVVFEIEGDVSCEIIEGNGCRLLVHVDFDG